MLIGSRDLYDNNAAIFLSNVLTNSGSLCVIHNEFGYAKYSKYWTILALWLKFNNNCSLCFNLIKILTFNVDNVTTFLSNILTDSGSLCVIHDKFGYAKYSKKGQY